MYDRLRAINEDGTGRLRQEFIDEISELLPPANVQSFAARLDDLLALVRDGKVTAVPEPTEANPTPWLASDVTSGMLQQANTYSLAQDNLPQCPEFLPVRVKADELVGTFVTRDCSDLLLMLQLEAQREMAH